MNRGIGIILLVVVVGVGIWLWRSRGIPKEGDVPKKVREGDTMEYPPTNGYGIGEALAEAEKMFGL